jgi:hypothetical protein
MHTLNGTRPLNIRHLLGRSPSQHPRLALGDRNLVLNPHSETFKRLRETKVGRHIDARLDGDDVPGDEGRGAVRGRAVVQVAADVVC